MKPIIALTLYILGGLISMYYFGIKNGVLDRALKKVKKQYGDDYDKVMSQTKTQILCSVFLICISMLWPIIIIVKFLQLFKKR